jgi:hypothetical protein
MGLTTRLVLEMIGTMLLVSSTGCSFIFVHNREVPPESPPDCTRSRLALVVDFVVAAGAVAVGVWGMNAAVHCEPHCGESVAGAYGAVGIVTAAVAKTEMRWIVVPWGLTCLEVRINMPRPVSGLDLRVVHPKVDPSEVSKRLGLVLFRGWRAGDIKQIQKAAR